MAEEVSLQTIDYVVRRSKEVSKLMSDSTVEQMLKDNQDLIGYSSDILDSLESIEATSIRNTAATISAIEASSSEVRRSIAKQTADLEDSIGRATSDIVGSVALQTQILSSKIQDVDDALKVIDLDIKDVMIAMKEQTAIQTKTLQVLEEIHETLKHPLEAESNELFERGSQWMAKGFLSDSVDAFLQSIEKNPTNYLTHYYLGVIYLCGKNEDENMIDLDKAENEFKLAIRYSKPDLGDKHVKQYAILMHQNYSDLFYTRALMGENSEHNYENAYQELMKALALDDSEETQSCLNSRLVKCSNRTNRAKELTQYATVGFANDYACLSYFTDPELVERKPELTTAVKNSREMLLEKIGSTVAEKPVNLEALREVAKLLPKTKDYPYLSLYEVSKTIQK